MSDCILGCGETEIFVTQRCGSPTIGRLTGVSEAVYTRLLDETGQAVITVSIAGNGAADEACCDILGRITSWAMEISIVRDGQIVFAGPIVGVLHKRSQVIIAARDVTAWLDKRLIHNDLDFTEGTNMTAIAEAIIRDALEPDDPCVLDYLDVSPSVLTAARTYGAESQYAGEAIRELTGTGVDYTTVGRRIILGGPLIWGPFATLRDEDILADVEVEERGLEAATSWLIEGSGVVGRAGGVDSFYGLLESRFAEDEILTEDDANVSAASRLDASNPPPLFVTVPGDSKLSPQAPVCFEQLIPGVLIGVSLQDLCRPVQVTQRLVAVGVTVNGEDESVAISLAPIGQTLDQGITFDDLGQIPA